MLPALRAPPANSGSVEQRPPVRVVVNGAEFTSGTITFDGATLTGCTVTFNGAEFTIGAVTFDGARFRGGVVTRDGTEFRGWPPPPEEGPEPIGPGAE